MRRDKQLGRRNAYLDLSSDQVSVCLLVDDLAAANANCADHERDEFWHCLVDKARLKLLRKRKDTIRRFCQLQRREQMSGIQRDTDRSDGMSRGVFNKQIEKRR